MQNSCWKNWVHTRVKTSLLISEARFLRTFTYLSCWYPPEFRIILIWQVRKVIHEIDVEQKYQGHQLLVHIFNMCLTPCLYSLRTCGKRNTFPDLFTLWKHSSFTDSLHTASRNAYAQLTVYTGSVPSHQMPQKVAGWLFTQCPLHSRDWSLAESWVMLPNFLSGQSDKLILIIDLKVP